MFTYKCKKNNRKNKHIHLSCHCLENFDKKSTSCYRLILFPTQNLTSSLNIMTNQPIYVSLFTEHLHAFPEEVIFVLCHGQLIFGFLKLSLLNIHYMPACFQHFLSLFQLSLTVLQLNLKVYSTKFTFCIPFCVLFLFDKLFACFAFQDFIFLICGGVGSDAKKLVGFFFALLVMLVCVCGGSHNQNARDM